MMIKVGVRSGFISPTCYPDDMMKQGDRNAHLAPLLSLFIFYLVFYHANISCEAVTQICSDWTKDVIFKRQRGIELLFVILKLETRESTCLTRRKVMVEFI